MKKKFVMLLGLISSMHMNADLAAQSPEITPSGGLNVGRIVVRSNGAFDIQTTDSAGWQLPSCPNALYARVEPGHLNHDKIYVLALAAKHGDKKMFFRATCHTNPQVLTVIDAFELP